MRNRTVFAGIVGALLAALGAAAEPATSVAGTALVIFDGDTVAMPGGERLRLVAIDTPEISGARCEREAELGRVAKLRLGELLRAGEIAIERTGTDRYHRTLATLRLADGRDVGEILVAEGLAVRYLPGRKAWVARFRHWCPCP